MNKLLVFVSIIFFNLIAFSQDKNYYENQIIVKFKKDINLVSINVFDDTAINSLNTSHHITKIEGIGNTKITNTYLLTFDGSNSTHNILENYKNSNLIEFAEPNYIAYGSGVKGSNLATFPNDTYFNRQWGLFNNGSFSVSGMPFVSTNDADTDMELAWDIETGDPNLIIAVSDTGLNMSHQDISSRIWNKTVEVIDGIDNDGNGLIDDYNGWDWVNGDNQPTDDHGHGTNCTGIIGAISNNSVGYAGVNWNSKIMPLKVLGSSNTGSYANIANSIYYAADNGAKILSMSIGGTGVSTTVLNAIDYANTRGMLLVVCMMNTNNNIIYYPAGYASTRSNVIAVGSTNSNDARTNPFFWSSTSGSNYGSHITVVAPGNYIWGLGISSNFDYNSYWGGTSQATPLVAGIASLIKSYNADYTPSQIKTLISNTAQDLVGIQTEDSQGWDQYMGWGRVNAFNALNQLFLNNNNFEYYNNNIVLINPVENHQIKVNVPQDFIGVYKLTIIDMIGRKILDQEINLKSGENIIPFEKAKGNYIVTLKGNKYSKVYKIANK